MYFILYIILYFIYVILAVTVVIHTRTIFMVIRVVEFSSGGYKFKKKLSKNQHTQRKLLNFESWCNGELSKKAKIWFSKSIFYTKDHQFSKSNDFLRVWWFLGKNLLNFVSFPPLKTWQPVLPWLSYIFRLPVLIKRETKECLDFMKMGSPINDVI